MSAVVLDTLALWAEDETLLIGVPCAFSATAEQPTNASTFIAIRYQRSGELEQNAQRLQADIHHGLEHLSWSGVRSGSPIVVAKRKPACSAIDPH